MLVLKLYALRKESISYLYATNKSLEIKFLKNVIFLSAQITETLLSVQDNTYVDHTAKNKPSGNWAGSLLSASETSY